jgi:hypothetical protein
MWSYHPPALFPQPVTGNQMETDQVEDVGGKRGNWKERSVNGTTKNLSPT